MLRFIESNIVGKHIGDDELMGRAIVEVIPGKYGASGMGGFVGEKALPYPYEAIKRALRHFIRLIPTERKQETH